jgi:hypothetical protein
MEASAGARWRVILPTAILVVVAALQIALTRTVGLTAWKGGGFGMFAAVDGGAVRTVRIVVDRDGRSEEIDVPLSLAVDAERAAAFPGGFMLSRLADGVIAREQRQGRPLTRVTLEIWGAALSTDGSQAEARRLAVLARDVGRDVRP